MHHQSKFSDRETVRTSCSNSETTLERLTKDCTHKLAWIHTWTAYPRLHT